MTVQCPICHNSSKVVLKEKRLNLYKCNSCLHTFTTVTCKEKEKYNNEYFIETHKNWFNNPNYGLFEYIYNKLLKLIGNKKIKLLDVGCGNGDFLKYIAAKNSTAKLYGIDLIYNKHPRIHFIKGDLFEEKIETNFNVICSLAVVEHVEDPHLFVQRLNNFLQPGGFIFLTTVNNNSLMYRIARLLNIVGLNTAHDRLYSIHHLQHYTNQSLRTLIEMNDFNVLDIENHNYPINAVDVPESNFLIKKIYKFFIWLIFILSKPFKCGILQTIICRKSPS